MHARPSRYSSKQAEFYRVKSQIDKIDERLDVIVEQYNTKTLAFGKTKRELQSCSVKLQAAERDLAIRKSIINKRVASVYRQGGLSYLDILLNTKDLNQFLYYLKLIERQAETDARIVAQLKESKATAEAQRSALLEKAKKQKAIIAEIKAEKNKIAAQLKERNRLLAKIESELTQYKLAELRRQARLRKALKVSYRIRPRIAVSRGGDRSSAVSIALEELGKPYVWGADGPGSFDCSGLTSYVYGKMGISLPHSSRAQYSYGEHVSMDNLQAGDLVFFARGGTISHVGIYVGGGNFIHAPQTGDVVKISSIHSHGGYVGAVRP